MKNIYLLPTKKPSKLVKIYNDVNRETFTLKLNVEVNDSFKEYVNVYVTSDEEIKDVRLHKWKWHLEKGNILNKFPNYLTDLSECKLVIMTTDQDLINDGVQEIDDDFLEWFVKNPNCEEIEVVDVRSLGVYGSYYPYKINIPKEDPKQETLEEAVKREYNARKFNSDYPFNPQSFILGAKWQQEQDKNLYSEDDLLNFGAFVRIEDRKEKRLFLIQDYYKKWKQI